MAKNYNNRIKYVNPSAGSCNWDIDWMRNNAINASLVAQGLDGNYVRLGGEAVAGVGLSIDMTLGECVVAGAEFEIIAQNIPLVGATVEAEEINFVFIDSTGSVIVTQDEPAVTCALLAIIDCSTTEVIRIIDGRRVRDIASVIVIPDPAGEVIDQVVTTDGNDGYKLAPRNIGKNLIINGNFDIWQRGISQTISGYGSADRWSNNNSVATKTASREAFTVGQTDVPNSPKYYLRTEVLSASSTSEYVISRQSIEDVTVTSGKTVTYSFWAKADATKDVAIEFSQFFDSVDANILSTNVAKHTLTTSWQKITGTVTLPSVAGKVIGYASLLEFQLWFTGGASKDLRTDSLGNQSGTFDIAQVKLEIGEIATDFEPRTYGEELALCQRYYVSIPHRVYGVAAYNSTGNYSRRLEYTYPVAMRVVPSNTWLDLGWIGGDPITQAGSILGIALTGTATGALASTTVYSFTADAEL